MASALLVTTALGTGMVFSPGTAHAQAAQNHDIPAGPLAVSLNRLAETANIKLIYDATLTSGLSSSELKGRFSPAEALSRLLAGSGLAFRQTGPGAFTLEPAPQVSDGSIQLGPVRVGGDGGEGSGMALGSMTSDVGATEGTKSYAMTGLSRTATRLPLSIKETPQSVTVVTRQQIDDFALVTIADVMAQTPGITVSTYDSDRSYFTARGFAISSYQYDGTPMIANAAYSAGNSLSNMAIYDRVEILKGSAGLLTGAGTPGATINLVRKKPTREFQGRATLAAGSWRNYRGELDVGGPLTESGNIRARVVGAYQDRHSFMEGHERKSAVLYGILEADLTPDTLLTVGGDYQDNNPRRSSWSGTRPIFDRDGKRISLPRSYNSGANWSRWDQYTRTIFSTLEHRFSDDWSVKVQLNHQINGYDAPLGSIQAGPFADGSSTIYANKYTGKTTSDTADIWVNGKFDLFGREHEISVGAAASRSHWKGKSYANVVYPVREVSDFWNWNGEIPEPIWGAPSSYQDTLTRQTAVYATGRFSIADGLKLMLGGRVTRYNDGEIKENGVAVPYGALIYDLTSNLSAYASFTSIFDPQDYLDPTGRRLAPLRGQNYEVGVKGQFLQDRLNASLAYYQLRQDNFAVQLENVFAPNGDGAYEALQGVVTKGFEAELSGELSRGWQVQAGFSHNLARRQGSRVTTTAPINQFKLYTTYQPATLDRLTIGGGARWQSRTWQTIMNYAIGQTEYYGQNSYVVVDALARYKLSDTVQVSVNVNNLFDTAYRTNIGFYRTTSYGEPRNAMATINVTF